MSFTVSASEAKGFWKDAMGTIWGDPDRDYSSGVMGTEMIAEYLDIPAPVAELYLMKCADCHITTRQNGGWVI